MPHDMAAKQVDHLKRARLRAQRVPSSRRVRLGQALVWPSLLGGVLNWFLDFVDLPYALLNLTTFVGVVLIGDGTLWPFRRRPKRLALGHPMVALAALGTMVPGARVHVRGRIRAQERMATYLGTIDDAVYSHLALIGARDVSRRPYQPLPAYRERARSFMLVDDEQVTVEIVMSEAKVVEPMRKFVSRDRKLAWALFNVLELREPARALVDLASPSVTEYWLQDGDEVEVVGTIDLRPNSQRESLPREMNTRPALISTQDQPLTVQLLR